MGSSRTINASKNIVIGAIAQVVTLALSIVSRKIFVMFLSTEYLGINGLYGNILSVLALAELGLGNVAQYFLYKPVEEKNYIEISNLMRFFKRMYRVISLVVLVLGLSLIPFLNIIVNSDLTQSELILYYVLFLINSVVSYFGADKIALLAANQDNRLQKYVTMGSTIIFQLVYIAVLMIWHNYTIYVLVTILCTFSNAVIINLICFKRYPYILDKNSKSSFQIDKKRILNDIKATFLYKIGATIVNNTSNIMISVLISTSMVGIYSNYNIIVVAVQGFIGILSRALVSGVGNLGVAHNTKRMHSMFKQIMLIYNFIAAFGGISLYLLLNDFIPIWLGKQYLLMNSEVFAIAFAFYLTNAISPLWIFREANGLFKKVKYLFLFTAFFNILFSIILGKFMGLFGILLAPSIARIVTQVWYEPYLVYKNLFDMSCSAYWKLQIKYLILTGLSLAFCYLIHDVFPVTLLFILLNSMVILLISMIVFILGTAKTDELTEIVLRTKRALKL